MLATLADPPLTGIVSRLRTQVRRHSRADRNRTARASRAPQRRAQSWSRLGNDKTTQFPSIVSALAAFGAAVGEPLVVDGEIVALDASGRPMGFQRLQGRIHLSDAKDVERIDREQPVAFIAFDILREGNEDLRGLPLVERRARLERLFKRSRKSEHHPHQRAGDRRRPRAARAREGRRMGRADRQGSAVTLPVGPPQPVVAQAQTSPRAGIRRRRLDRAAQHAAVLRGAAARRVSASGDRGSGVRGHGAGLITDLRRPHGHGVRSARARAGVEAAQGARDEAVAVRRQDQEQRNRALGAARARRAGPLHGVDRRWEPAPSGVSRACATTRSQRAWCGRSRRSVESRSARRQSQQRLRPERGAQSPREGYGETSPKLEERRRAPREASRRGATQRQKC